MWTTEKIRHQKSYFAEQRKNPTGKFTEFIVRTYYCIYKACWLRKGNYCLADSVNNYRIKNIVYEGFYNNQPDHDYNNVINDCKRYLMEMGYIRRKHQGAHEIIFINKPLDFLVPSEHATYLKKFGISEINMNSNSIKVTIHPITDEKTLTTLLNHMEDPNKYADPFEKSSSSTSFQKVLSTGISCERCEGYYLLRNGKYGYFLGCCNFPKCKSTKSISDITYSLLVQNGVHIYEVETSCWKCGKQIKLRSYFPQLDLLELQPDLAKVLDLSIIRLSIVDSLDQYLSMKYSEIYLHASKKAGFSYIANNCPYCHSLQGSQMTLSKVYDFLLTALENHLLSKYVVDTLSINDTILPKEEWKKIIDEVIKMH